MRKHQPWIALLVVACSTPGVSSRTWTEPVVFQAEHAAVGFDVEHTTGVTRGELGAPVDSVVAVLPEVLSGAKLAVTEVNAKDRRVTGRLTGVRGTLAGQRPSTFFSCGESAMGRTADRYALSVTVAAHAQPAAGDRTALTLQATAIARPDDSGVSVTCSSNGKFERRLADALAARLVPAAAKG